MINKKIALLSCSFPPIPGGGIESANYSLYKMLIDKGYDVHVYTYLDFQLDKNYKELDVRVKRFGATKFQLKLETYLSVFERKFEKWILNRKLYNGDSYQFKLVKYSNMVIRKINHELIKFKPDIVILGDYGAPGYTLIKLPYAKYYHVSHHNPARFINNPIFPQNYDDAMKAVAYEQKSLSKIDKVVCVSNYQKDVFVETFKYSNPIIVIPNIIDEEFIYSIEKSDIHKQLNIDKSYPIVYIPSAGSKVKGEQYVVEIVRRISSALENKVAFYLSGGITPIQRFEFDTLNKYHLFIPGFVDYSVNISYIKDCIICVSPTILESFGMALLEAQFCELPCVTFDVGGNRDFIVQDKNGYLVPLLDIERLIGNAVNLLNNSDIRSNMIENAKLINKNFTANHVFKKYLSLINE